MPQEKPTKFNFNISDFQSSPETGQTSEHPTEHTNSTEISKDLDDFDKKTDQMEQTPSDFDKFLDQVERNPTPENIEKLRKANKSLEENAKDPLDKHVRLASRFTKKVQVRINGQVLKAYKINFANRAAAEGNIGLGDIMPPHMETVAVYNEKGELITDRAVRRINAKNRIGYYDYDSGAYIPVFNNYFTVPKGTRTNSKKDITLSLRKMKEETSLFNQPQDTRREEEQDDLTVAPSMDTPKKRALGGTSKESQYKDKPKNGIKFPASRQDLKKMGFKSVNKVPVAVREKADEILRKGNKIGTTTIIEFNGKKWAFRDEVHCHPPSDKGKVSDSLLRPHHGISVLGEA